MSFRLILASASTARAQVLTRAGFSFETIVSEVDEDSLIANRPVEPTPAEIATVLAEAKGSFVAQKLAPTLTGPTVILAADSVFEFDNQAWGKPYEPEIAVARLLAQAGGTGVLHTGHWIGYFDPHVNVEHRKVVLDSASVTFADVEEQTIRDYVATGEPLGCAGGFTLEGRGAILVEAVSGDPNTVLGLSLNTIRHTLKTWSLSLTSAW